MSDESLQQGDRDPRHGVRDLTNPGSVSNAIPTRSREEKVEENVSKEKEEENVMEGGGSLFLAYSSKIKDSKIDSRNQIQ